MGTCIAALPVGREWPLLGSLSINLFVNRPNTGAQAVLAHIKPDGDFRYAVTALSYILVSFYLEFTGEPSVVLHSVWNLTDYWPG